MPGTGSDFCSIGSHGMDQCLSSKKEQQKPGFSPAPVVLFLLSLKAAAASLVTLAGACTCNSNFICMALFLLIKGTFTGFAVYGNGLTSASCVYAVFCTSFFLYETSATGFICCLGGISVHQNRWITAIDPLSAFIRFYNRIAALRPPEYLPWNNTRFYYTHMFLLYNLMLASFYLLNSYFISDSISPFSKFIPKFLIF